MFAVLWTCLCVLNSWCAVIPPVLLSLAALLLAGSFPWMRRSLAQWWTAVPISELQPEGKAVRSVTCGVWSAVGWNICDLGDSAVSCTQSFRVYCETVTDQKVNLARSQGLDGIRHQLCLYHHSLHNSDSVTKEGKAEQSLFHVSPPCCIFHF